MPKFRKKPIVIEARQLPPHVEDFASTAEIKEFLAPLVLWIRESGGNASPRIAMAGIDIQTREGVMLASPGDWIIQGIANEFYPCKPDIFEATYEAVSS